MMEVILNLEEARDWFIEHSTGSVTCKDGDREQVVDCFPEAEKFFAEEAGSGQATVQTREDVYNLLDGRVITVLLENLSALMDRPDMSVYAIQATRDEIDLLDRVLTHKVKTMSLQEFDRDVSGCRTKRMRLEAVT